VLLNELSFLVSQIKAACAPAFKNLVVALLLFRNPQAEHLRVWVAHDLKILVRGRVVRNHG